MPHVGERLRKVKEFRLLSERKSTIAIANYPEKYNVEVVPTTPFLVLPEVSSERRTYLPIGWLLPPTIPSNKLRIMLNSRLWHFAILTSAMHMAWTRNVGGRLKSDFQYGIGVVYNTFPWPNASPREITMVETLAQTILDERSKYSASTLADLYDPDNIKPDLLKAHKKLDAAVDELYKKGGFNSERSRAEHLLGVYEQASQPLTSQNVANRTKRRKNLG